MQQYNSAGLVSYAASNDSTYYYIYDNQGRITNENLDHLQAVINTSYGNRRDELRSSVSIGLGYYSPIDHVTEYEYDNQQRVTSITQTNGGGASNAA